MRKKVNKINIHCWGGLGSQLFAWGVAEQVLEKYPRKNVVLVLHTSGVTKRESNIDFLSNKFQLVYKDDYRPKNKRQKIFSKNKLSLSLIFKKFFNQTSLIFTGDYLTNIEILKPWTLSLRGHYTNIIFPKKIIELMMNQIPEIKLGELNFSNLPSGIMGIHYRLGDLLELENKSYIEPNVLAQLILDLVRKEDFDKIVLYSDDISSAKKMLAKFSNLRISYCNKNIWETILDLCTSKSFIGTNSKISMWVILFRGILGNELQAYFPDSMKKNIERISPDIKDTSNITYY